MKRAPVKVIWSMILLYSICLILSSCGSKVEEPDQGKVSSMNQFSAFTLENELITEDILADKDLTLLLFWAPWSQVSVYELGQVGEYMKSVPENVQLITVCIDGNEKTAKAALKTAGIKDIPTLMSGNGDFTTVSDEIENLPTTIFLDHEGDIVGKPVVGAKEDIETYYTDEINKRLKKLGKSKIVLIEEESSESKADDKADKDISKEKSYDDNSSEEQGDDSYDGASQEKEFKEESEDEKASEGNDGDSSDEENWE